MPLLSAFTPCGMLACSSAPSHAEEIYNQLQGLYGPSFDFTVGSYNEAKLYAWAMGLAQCLGELEHAGNQAYPTRAYDLLPLLELDFQVTPGPNDTVPTRQRAVAAAEILTRGARAENVVNGLKAILGTNFLAYVTATPTAGAGIFGPSVSEFPDPTVTSFAHFTDVRVPARNYQLVDPVTSPGISGAWCAYAAPDGSTPTDQLNVGDVVVVQRENTAFAERVSVVASAASAPAGSNATPGYPCFQAVFAGSHGIGSSITTGNVPYWWSTQRLSWIVVTTTAVLDAESRRKVNQFMTRIARACSLWAIVQPTTTTASGGTVGPMVVGKPMGDRPIGAFTFTNSM